MFVITSVAKQIGLGMPFLETPKTGFSTAVIDFVFPIIQRDTLLFIRSYFTSFNQVQNCSLLNIFLLQQILDGFLSYFPATIRQCSKTIVSAAVEIYNRVGKDLLPTPSKCHYTFNLRDLSQCFQGVYRI